MNGDLARLMQLTAPHRWRMVLAILLGFATVAVGVGLMSTSAYLVSLAALRPSIADLRVAIAGVRFFGISRGVFRYLERLVSHQVTFELLTHIRVWFYRSLEPLAPARLLGYRSGDVLSRIVSDIETLEHLYLRVIGPTLVAVLTAGLTWVLLSAQNVGIAATAVGVFAASGIVASWTGRCLGRAPGRQLVALRSELNAVLVDGVQGVSDLLVFDHGRHVRRTVRGLGRQFEALHVRMAGIRGLGSALTSFGADLAVFASLWMAIPLVTEGELDGIDIAVVALTVLAAFEAVTPLPSAYQHLEESVRAARRLFDVIDAEPAVREPTPGRPLPSEVSLEVERLRFVYPTQADRPALDGVSFSLPEKGRVAIVGPSGAGKSTLLHLILRFWDYSQGSIRLGGEELKHMSSEELRSKIAVVPQNTHLFSGTVRDNLRLARPSAGEEEIVDVSRRVQMHEFIESLPDGYDTWIGEHGLRLSGGQRRRLVIARALLQGGPLVLLDEPTANLDPLTERRLLAELYTLLAGRTVLVVTHRLIGLDGCDEIVVLHCGRVVERGRHDELARGEGLYRKMLDLQRGAAVADWVLTEEA